MIDNSFSMRAGSRLADAKNAANRFARFAKPRTARPGHDARFAAASADRRLPGYGATCAHAVDSIAAGRLPRELSANSREGFGPSSDTVHTPIELHFFSDMQKSDMPASFRNWPCLPNVSLILHPVVKDAAPNWTVESVNAPGQVWDPKKTHVQAVVAGFDTPAATRTVSLVVNGKTIATQNASVPANGRATVEFQTPWMFPTASAAAK